MTAPLQKITVNIQYLSFECSYHCVCNLWGEMVALLFSDFQLPSNFMLNQISFWVAVSGSSASSVEQRERQNITKYQLLLTYFCHLF